MTTKDELVAQLRALGVREGGVLLLHSSFRAVRPVEGGPLGLIAALREALGPAGTLAMPSATGDDDAPFDPATTANREDLGIVASLFWQQPGVVRSAHFDAVAAIGPKAAWIAGGPFVLPPAAPGSAIDRIREAGGQVLLLGVGHDANTTLHLAELLGGAPYRSDFHYTDPTARGWIMARMTAAARGSRWPTTGFAPRGSSARGGSATPMRGCSRPRT